MRCRQGLPLLTLTVATSLAMAQPAPLAEPAVRIRVIVQMKPPDIAGGLAAAMANPAMHLAFSYAAANVTAVRRVGVPGMATAEVTDAGLQALHADPQVLRVVEDRLSRPTLLQTVHIVGADASTLPSSGSTAGTGQVIAILDTGIASSHPFLKGKVIDEACFSTGESSLYRLRSLCPNGLDTQVTPGAAADCDAHVAGCGHGTHVAGIAAGGPIAIAGQSMRGVAPGARIMSIQVYTRFEDAATCAPQPAPCALSFASDQIRALEYVHRLSTKYRVAAVNMSLGSGAFSQSCPEDPLADVVAKLGARGIAVIASSGNDGLIGQVAAPACVPGVIPVGAVTKGNALAIDFSNASELVTLLAPGDQILSAVGSKDFAPKRGTSMAAPHVSAAWAILRQGWPAAKTSDIARLLQSGGTEVVDPRTGQRTPSIRIDVAHTMAKKLAQAGPPAAAPLAAAAAASDDTQKRPTRVIVEVPNSPEARTLSASDLRAKIQQAVGADAVVRLQNQRVIVEHAPGISAEAEARIKQILGSGTRTARDRLSAPQ